MKVVIFGATGGTGRHLVEQAYALGHEVTAFTRNPARLEPFEELEVVRGDVLDPAAVSRAVRGQDAVIVALGGRASGDCRVRSEGTANVVRAMLEHGVRRLIAVSSFGVGDSRKGLMGYVAWLLLREALLDHERQEEVVRGSGLDWTIVRPTGLTNEPRTGRYKVGTPGRGRIPRADVADFILRELKENAYVHQAPVLGS